MLVSRFDSWYHRPIIYRSSMRFHLLVPNLSQPLIVVCWVDSLCTGSRCRYLCHCGLLLSLLLLVLLLLLACRTQESQTVSLGTNLFSVADSRVLKTTVNCRHNKMLWTFGDVVCSIDWSLFNTITFQCIAREHLPGPQHLIPSRSSYRCSIAAIWLWEIHGNVSHFFQMIDRYITGQWIFGAYFGNPWALNLSVIRSKPRACRVQGEQNYWICGSSVEFYRVWRLFEARQSSGRNIVSSFGIR